MLFERASIAKLQDLLDAYEEALGDHFYGSNKESNEQMKSSFGKLQHSIDQLSGLALLQKSQRGVDEKATPRGAEDPDPLHRQERVLSAALTEQIDIITNPLGGIDMATQLFLLKSLRDVADQLHELGAVLSQGPNKLESGMPSIKPYPRKETQDPTLEEAHKAWKRRVPYTSKEGFFVKLNSEIEKLSHSREL